MDRLTDQELLGDYVERRSETAFTEVVRRNVDFVYSAALRMVRDAHLAEDVTQSTFVALAKNARQLTDRPVLSGWLHRTTQHLAAKTVRSEVRRRAREQEAIAMNELLSAESEARWEQIAPHLDNALGELSEPDRDAILLRYFQRKSAREMAATLGTSEEAAQKRVSRAVERMRELFAKRGVTVGASGLMLVLSANAVQAAPIGLTATISASATLSTSGFSIAQLLSAKTVAGVIAGVVVLGSGTFVLVHSLVPAPATPAVAAPPARGARNSLAGLVSGILKMPDGKPLAGVEVFLSTASVPVPVYSDRSDKVQTTATGQDGRFAFPDEPENRAVIAVHESGYAQATVAELAKRPELVLQPWARIEGTLRQGTKRLANQTIHLSRSRFGSKIQERAYRTVHSATTTTDGEGRYSFDRVAPGDTWIYWRTDKGNYDVQFRYVDVQPGQSITVDIGGRGRAITGRAVLMDAEKPAKFYGSVWPKTPHRMPRPPNWSELSSDEQDALTAAWEKTPDAKLYNQEKCPIDFRVAADGSFTVPDLPAGEYRVVIASWTGAPVASQMISRGQAQITIEEMPGGRSDEPQNIGTVEAFYARPLQPGDAAPLFETTTFAGERLKLSDHKGKYVLLNFWRTDLPEFQEEMESLKAAQTTWGKDKRFILIGLNADPGLATAQQFITNHKLTWTHCFIGNNYQIPARYRLRRPTSIFIGPDGRIVHPELHGAEIAPALQDALRTE
jgi:RNA polymerase sigma factor (sigma-70 family)